MATGGTTQTSENRAYLFRLQILIIDGGLLVLRNILDQTLTSQGISLRVCLNQGKPTIKRLKSKGVITQVQYDQLFPTVGQVPTSSDLDITLIIFLLRSLKCFGFNKKFNWNATPKPTDKTIEADIFRLKAFRNKISHISNTTDIQPNHFVTLWNDIEQILARLSPPALNVQQIIADFKVCTLDPEEEKRVHEELIKWKDYEDNVDRLKKEMTDLEIRVTEVEKNQDGIIRQLNEVSDKSNEGVSSMQTEEEKYNKHKKELKGGLFEFYKTRHSKVFLSPLFEEKDIPLASFYIRPELSEITSRLTGEDEEYPVHSLSKMFETENEQNREIYVLAEAGIGKTAFSKYLANLWCQAHCPDKDMKQFLIKDDIDCMYKFEFLFLILLRDSDDLCSIDDLIFEKIVLNLGLEENLSKSVLLKILKNEKCLILLDGLDEWTHPDKKCYRSPRSIPHRNDREKCTVLTTTRPWKLGDLDLNSCQLEKRVKLTQLCFDSVVTLTERILRKRKPHLNKDSLDCDVSQFIETISKRQNAELAFVPLLLIYTTCLWCEGVQIGNSRCDLYINIVELLLSRTIQIHGEFQQLREDSSNEIPECFAEYDNCKKYFPLLQCLGKLAYHTLFNETRENTLVFDGSIARKHLTSDEIEFSLHSGMLSESTSKTSRKKNSRISFSHKTVQEFFAAIFINSQNIVLEKCKSVQDILDISEICKFISKINVDWMCRISNDLMSVINEDEKTHDYRTKKGKISLSDTQLYEIQKMFMSCLQEMPESEHIKLCLQDFFIDEKTEYSEELQRLLKQNKINIKSLCINTFQTSMSLREIIDIFSLKDLSHIHKLCYHGSMKEAEIDLILFPSLQYVTLRYGKLTNDDVNLSESLALLQNVQYLYIYHFMLPHRILETFFNFLSSQNSIKEIEIERLYCEEHDKNCTGLKFELSKHSPLTNLDLQELPRLQLNITTQSLVYAALRYIALDESSLLLSRDMLNIEYVELWEIETTAGSLHNFITVLEKLPQSVLVEMSAIKPETEYKHIRNYIRKSRFYNVEGNRNWFLFFILPRQKRCQIL